MSLFVSIHVVKFYLKDLKQVIIKDKKKKLKLSNQYEATTLTNHLQK